MENKLILKNFYKKLVFVSIGLFLLRGCNRNSNYETYPVLERHYQNLTSFGDFTWDPEEGSWRCHLIENSLPSKVAELFNSQDKGDKRLSADTSNIYKKFSGNRYKGLSDDPILRPRERVYINPLINTVAK